MLITKLRHFWIGSRRNFVIDPGSHWDSSLTSASGSKITESSQGSLDCKIEMATSSKIAVCSQGSLDCKVVMVRLAQDH
jgi:hypothetical protein